jgi:His/Glu/Gln/Arg/opine family amino acid ABC transporter permease subunit
MAFDWSVIWRHSDLFVNGAALTLVLAVVVLLAGTAIGIIGAYARLSTVRPIALVAAVYVEFVRGIPPLLIIFFSFFGLPALGLTLDGVHAVMVGMSVYAGTYMTEIIRAGIIGVKPGQIEASKALGLSNLQTARQVVLPQAFRIAMPATGNQFISLVKDTSLAAAISVKELTFAAQFVSNLSFRVFEAYLTVAAIYLVINTVLALSLRGLERWLARHE